MDFDTNKATRRDAEAPTLIHIETSGEIVALINRNHIKESYFRG